MKYGLKENDIKKINVVFANYPEVERALLYGSRSKGNYRNGSDIDLTLAGRNLSLDVLLKIETDLDEIMLPYRIELSIFDNIDNPSLVEHIKRVRKEFYVKSLRKSDINIKSTI